MADGQEEAVQHLSKVVSAGRSCGDAAEGMLERVQRRASEADAGEVASAEPGVLQGAVAEGAVATSKGGGPGGRGGAGGAENRERATSGRGASGGTAGGSDEGGAARTSVGGRAIRDRHGND
jgi:hypothetical protein